MNWIDSLPVLDIVNVMVAFIVGYIVGRNGESK